MAAYKKASDSEKKKKLYSRLSFAKDITSPDLKK